MRTVWCRADRLFFCPVSVYPSFTLARHPKNILQSSSHGGGGVSIQEAAGQGDLETLKALLAANKSALNSRDESGCSALHFAADRGQAAVVQLLVEAGANLNAADADGQTALHYGAMCGHEEVRC